MCCPGFVAGRKIDDVFERLVRNVAAVVLYEDRHDQHWMADGRNVRSDAEVWSTPEWAVVGNRLHVEHVERCAAEMRVSQRRDQGVVVDDVAAPDIDEVGARRQQWQRIGIEQLVGSGRGRQRGYQVVAAGQELIEAIDRQYVVEPRNGLAGAAKAE